MSTFFYKFKDVLISAIPNDGLIEISSYLSDSNDDPFIDSNTQGIDTFIVATLKSTLPTSGYQSFFSILINRFIAEKYNTTLGGATLLDSNIITLTGQNDTTDNLVVGLNVVGDGIPIGTTLLQIRDKKSVVISQDAEASASITVNYNTSEWVIDFTDLTRLLSIIDFSAI